MTIDYAAHLEITNAPNEALELATAVQRIQFLARVGVTNLDARILEIGPGHGAFIRALKAAGYRNVRAIEADKTLAERAGAAGLPIDWCPADATVSYLQKHSDQFDVICSAHVLEHVERSEQLAFLSAIRQALVPGGTVVCEVPNATSPVASLHRYWDWTHQCLFTWTSLEFVLKAAGFDRVTIAAVKNAGRPPNVALAALLSVLRIFSHAMYRIHLLAELGRRAFEVPVTSAIIAAAHRPD